MMRTWKTTLLAGALAFSAGPLWATPQAAVNDSTNSTTQVSPRNHKRKNHRKHRRHRHHQRV